MRGERTRHRGGRAAGALALALALALVASLVPQAGLTSLAFADEAPAVGDTFTVDGLVYKVTVAADGTGADEAGTVTLTDGTGSEEASLSIGMVSQEGDEGTWYYAVTAVGSSAFEGNTALVEIEFTEDLTGPTSGLAIQASAFEDCTALQRVSFPEKVEGIGDRAFAGCTALTDVDFPDGAELYVKTIYSSPAIGANAFKGCTALTSITIPAITSTTRFGDYYYDFDYYNPDSNQVIGVNSLSYLYYSGYQSYWHSGAAPTCRNGIGGTAFSGCTALETVVFQAGAGLGAYAYFYIGSDSFEGCTSLSALVFECDQAYATDPNGSMHNATYSDPFEDLDQEVVRYYAVDYYYTQDEADDDDDAGTGRLARVEYARGTSVADIQAGDAEALEESVFDADAYAHDGYADGVVPDPNEAAVEAFGEEAADSEWVWKLTGTQSQREGLTDSCQAYLVQADDLSAGRLVSDVSAALQKRSDQNFSRWIVDGVEQDCSFDASRYYNDSYYDFTTADTSDDPADDLFISVGSGGEESFLGQIEVYAADGEQVDLSSCEVTYQRFDATLDEVGEAEGFDEAMAAFSEDGGPLLVTVTPGEETGYTGSLQVWVLVQGNGGSVLERYTDSASGALGTSPTWYYATAKSETQGSGTATYTGPYAVMVGGSDLSSALVACAYAGLADASINVADSDDDSYGFYLGTEFSSTSGALTSTDSSDGQAFSAEGYSASEFAAACYAAFQSTKSSGPRSKLGVEEEDYPWGDTALLLDVGALEDVAAAAASLAYAASAPVFYTEEDGTVSQDTLECLADFERVVLLGGEDMADLDLDETGCEVVDGLVSEALNASAVSRDMADFLMEEGLATASVVTVSDAADAFDAIGALNRSGHEGGITLVCGGSADVKQVSAYVRALRDDVSTVRLFGRSSGNVLAGDFDLCDSFTYLWDERGNYVEPVIAEGDTVEIAGLSLAVGQGSGSAEDPFAVTYDATLWGDATLSAGTYEVDGTYYVLSEDVPDAQDDEEEAEEAEEEEEEEEADEDSTDDATSDADDGSTSDADSDTDSDSDSDSTEASSGSSSGSSGTSSSTGSSSGSAIYVTTYVTTTRTRIVAASTVSSSTGLSLASSASSSSSSSGSEDDGEEDDEEDVSDATTSTAAYEDNGWDVTNVGTVTDVAAVSTVTSGVTSSSSGSAGLSLPLVVAVCVALATAALIGGLWLMARRRNEGFDNALEAC